MRVAPNLRHLLSLWKLATWLTAFVAVNHVYLLTVEEPGLVGRFGQAYRDYAARAPRWMPRRTPPEP